MLYSETPEIHMRTMKIGVLDVSGVPGGFSVEVFRRTAAVTCARCASSASIRPTPT